VSWADLFERAGESGASLDDVRETVDRRREERSGATDSDSDSDSDSGSDPDSDVPGESTDGVRESSPARIVAGADVLAADLLVGGSAREALDGVRAHSWVRLVASDPLLDDAETAITELAGGDLATDWRERVGTERERVDHPAGDYPALAAAYRGGAMHVLSFDDDLQSAKAGAAIRAHVETSIKHPRAFAQLFDPEPLYEAVEEGAYPGPDCDPRA
jgi:hypothetical protein